MKKLLFLLAVHTLLLSQSQYIAWPENFLWPYLNFSGLTLYRDIFFIYPPVYPTLLTSWFAVFGLSIANLQFLSYLIIGITDVLIFFVAKKKIWPVVIYVPLQIFFEGNGLWPDQLLAPLFLASWLFFNHKKYFLLGFCLGLSLLVKQTALYFCLTIVVFLISGRPLGKDWSKLLAGSALCFFLLGLYLFFNQNYSDFFQQTIRYIFSHHATNSLQVQWPSSRQFFTLMMVGIPAAFVGLKSGRQKELFLMFTASMGVFTRFEYFHLQPALPFLAILLASGWISIPFFLAFLFLFSKFVLQSYRLPPRFLTADLIANAVIVNQFIPPGSRTLIINSWDHYYFLSKTLPSGNFFFSSTPWNWSYEHLEDRTIKTLENEKPKFVLYGQCFRISSTCYEPEKIGKYIRNHYQLVSKLPDGTGIFKNDPMRFRQKIQPADRQEEIKN